MNRKQLAKDAFWGNNEGLYAYVRDQLSYFVGDEYCYPANGVTLAECIAVVEKLTDDDLAELQELGIVA